MIAQSLFALSHIIVSLPAPYCINISSNSGEITPYKSEIGIFCLANFFLAAETVFNTLEVVKAIPFQEVHPIVQSSTVDAALLYSPKTSAST
jgi:hypothetical protein